MGYFLRGLSIFSFACAFYAGMAFLGFSIVNYLNLDYLIYFLLSVVFITLMYIIGRICE